MKTASNQNMHQISDDLGQIEEPAGERKNNTNKTSSIQEESESESERQWVSQQ